MYKKAGLTEAHNGHRAIYLGLLACFTLIFTISIVMLYIYDVRPLSYYAVMAMLALILLLEILYLEPSGRRTLVVLAQIMAYSLNLIWGVTLNYDLFFGRTDTLPHMWWAQSILDIGHVTDFMNVYEPFPLWHILCDTAYMMGGLGGSVARVMFVNSGLVYGILGTLCIFLLVRKISGDDRLPLLSALFLAFNPTFDFYGMYSIPRSIVMIMFILLMYLLIDRENKMKRWLAYGLTVPIVVYHTVSSLFIIVVLGLIYAIQLLFIRSKKEPIVTLRFLAVMVGVTAAYWALNATNIIWTITSSLLKSSSGATGLQTESVNTTPLTEVFNYSQYSVWILFVIIGALILLKFRHVDVKLKIFSLLALILIPLTYPGPLLLVNTLSSTASIGRFEEYSFMFMTIVAAAGFLFLSRRNVKFIGGLLAVAFIVMVFLSISNDFVASDNPLVKRPFYTYYLSDSEVTGINHVVQVTQGSVLTDYIAVRYLEKSPDSSKDHILEANIITDKLMAANATDVTLIRDGELSKRPIKLFSSDNGYVQAASWNALDYYYTGDPVFAVLDGENRIYSSGTMTAYN